MGKTKVDQEAAGQRTVVEVDDQLCDGRCSNVLAPKPSKTKDLPLQSFKAPGGESRLGPNRARFGRGMKLGVANHMH